MVQNLLCQLGFAKSQVTGSDCTQLLYQLSCIVSAMALLCHQVRSEGRLV